MLTLDNIKDKLCDELSRRLSQAGIMFHIFARAKSIRSLDHKMKIKGDKYRAGQKIQDMLGLRIVLYFSEDIDVLETFLCDDTLIERAADSLDVSTFRPKRLNLVRQLPDEFVSDFRSSLPPYYARYIDNTYEIQIRTVFSEGWHEVEHDMRYKCKEDWEGCDNYSRQLNGIIATLETAQWSMGAIFREMSWQNMLKHRYHAMLRNMLLIRFANDNFSPAVEKYLLSHREIVYQVHLVDRSVLILMFLNSPVSLPLTYDNVLFIINRLDVHDQGLQDLESTEFKYLFGQIANM